MLEDTQAANIPKGKKKEKKTLGDPTSLSTRENNDKILEDEVEPHVFSPQPEPRFSAKEQGLILS